MQWVCISEDQRRVYIQWLKSYKQNRAEFDLFEKWLQKGVVNDIGKFVPKKMPVVFNEAIQKSQKLIDESLKDTDPKIQIAALYYIIWYPDKFYIPTVKEMRFTSEQDEEFRKDILNFLMEFKPEEANLPYGYEEKKDKKNQDDIQNLLRIDLMGIEIGMSLIPVIDVKQGGDLLEKINGLRRQFAIDLGLVVPPVRIRDNMSFEPSEYVIKIKAQEVARGTIRPGMYCVFNPEKEGEMPEVNGIDFMEPVFGLKAKWVNKEEMDKIKEKFPHYTIVDAAAVISTHIKNMIKIYSYELLTRHDVQGIIEGLKRTSPVLINGIIPDKISVAKIHRVLQNLLKEQLSIRNRIEIFEILGDHADDKLSVEELTEVVKTKLKAFKVQT